MFVKAKKILVSEPMYAKSMDEEEAAEWLDDILAGVGTPAKRSAGVRKSPQKPSTSFARERLGDPGCSREWVTVFDG